jgi:hypothetical protein
LPRGTAYAILSADAVKKQHFSSTPGRNRPRPRFAHATAGRNRPFSHFSHAVGSRTAAHSTLEFPGLLPDERRFNGVSIGNRHFPTATLHWVLTFTY